MRKGWPRSWTCPSASTWEGRTRLSCTVIQRRPPRLRARSEVAMRSAALAVAAVRAAERRREA